ncbi:Fic family protein, partial [Sulfurihydrogenibium sp.]|uniref:Fic family protein n=1 Tax=Sulfurihydrogenibium sp. TaxID=2053621 RepID=UPI003D10AF20
KIGGLPEPQVKNKEWLYLLEEETRNSIMIEGFFVSEKELENHTEAFNYFKTASFVYGLAYENYKLKEFLFGTPLIRQINKYLGNSGEFRKEKIIISGFNPPELYVQEWIEIFINFVNHIEKDFSFEKLAVSHAFFEEIHPFKDGNGRTGRIILNYILISKGYPLVIIKGDEESKKLYYKGLEEIDRQTFNIFEKYKNKPPKKEEVLKQLNDVKSEILKKIIFESLIETLDKIIISIYEEKGAKLEQVSDLLTQLDYSPSSGRKLIKRGKIIAVKRNNKWYSVKNLVNTLL